MKTALLLVLAPLAAVAGEPPAQPLVAPKCAPLDAAPVASAPAPVPAPSNAPAVLADGSAVTAQGLVAAKPFTLAPVALNSAERAALVRLALATRAAAAPGSADAAAAGKLLVALGYLETSVGMKGTK